MAATGSGATIGLVECRVVQTTPETLTQKERSIFAPGAMEPHAECEEAMENARESNLAAVQKYICELLIENQELRMALMQARGPELDGEHALRF